jgi:hypothetical protein
MAALPSHEFLNRIFSCTVRFDLDKGRIVSRKMSFDRRVLGFSGGTSSMHFVSRLEERLLGPGEKLASKGTKKK